ncbi:hemin-degrading factor [Paraburkholderia tropica]|uniref:hemin-degrading factor n=1 Tax=Paraburkholderia tropica TaxID=92647 RepID=UPI0007ED327D|nr:ChuX/HutX family heme-like substrate-binding protein [Paraburkholderia tropica]MBB2979084.1 putative hemin transport protein [Paraburkholderia tropica]OBR51005.1 heme ABC transporter [Paraburkholderia tropica]
MTQTNFSDSETCAQWRESYLAHKTANKLRQRDAAAAMQVSEAQAVAAFVGVNVVRLKPDFMGLIAQMPRLGAVMTLTRNEAAVHEKDGVFEKVSAEGHVGLVLGADIDLRVFHRRWAFAFAVREASANGEMKSFQFYDAQGEAVFKVFLRAHSDHAAFDAIVAEWTDAGQSAVLALQPAEPAPSPRADDAIDRAGFHAAWAEMEDTHEFFPLLRKFGLTRTQALRLAEPRYVTRLADDVIETLLVEAAREQVPIMVFVGNAGMIQIHTGPVTNIRTMGEWVNVLDERFNLHLRNDLVASAWLVRKPTDDGIVTSVELFDAQGENIAMLFGARKPGAPELAAWRELAGALQSHAQLSAA